MESWKKVWRDGIAPLLSLPSLEALREALATDDSRLLQGCTTRPPPLWCVADWPAEGACALGYCGVIEAGGFGQATVGQAEEFLAKKCFEADQRLGEPAAVRWFLNAYDDWPRHEMIASLLPEVRREIERRKGAEASVA